MTGAAATVATQLRQVERASSAVPWGRSASIDTRSRWAASARPLRCSVAAVASSAAWASVRPRVNARSYSSMPWTPSSQRTLRSASSRRQTAA